MIISINNLSKSYYPRSAETVEVLRSLNMTVEKGETVAVTGSSGSGKTTFLTLAAGLEAPTSGNISIIGRDLGKMSEDELAAFRASHIGFIFQRFHLLPHFTALENVALPLEILGKPGSEERAKELLDSVGLGHRTGHLPEQLSGGECQRVAIARAIAAEPEMILADEPTGNLDHQTAESVTNLLFKLAEEKSLTMLVVTHNEELAKRCQRRLRLVKGCFE